MKALVVYDSAYGNTKTIAEAIGKGLGEGTTVSQVQDVKPDELSEYELVIVGSPTQGGRATAPIKEFLQRILPVGLKSTRVAAFDTRIPASEHGFALRLLMGLLGYAAPRIMRELKARGGDPVAGPEGFFVEDKEGPLREGEADRAISWAATVAREAATRA